MYYGVQNSDLTELCFLAAPVAVLKHGIGFFWVPAYDFQSGPDTTLSVDKDTQVIEILSRKGYSPAAIAGPAQGRGSTIVGVSESWGPPSESRFEESAPSTVGSRSPVSRVLRAVS